MAQVRRYGQVIRLVTLSKSFGPKKILDDVTFHFTSGERYGLVGANGTGKSTLLNIITGLDSADTGEVIRPKLCKIAYLPQYPNPSPRPTVVGECMSGDTERDGLLARLGHAETKLSDDYTPEIQDEFEVCERAVRHAGAHLLEGDARALLTGLGFSVADMDRHPLHFSGGWRMRLELAKIMLSQPDFLVLDEPTNHLDLPTISWLEWYLKGFAGCLLYVSHDRSLLNRLSTQTLHLRAGKLASYPGGFDAFLEASTREQEERARLSARVASEAERLEDFAKRYGAKASLAARAKSKLRMAEKLRSLEADLSAEQGPPEGEITLRIPEAPPCGREVLRCQNLRVGHSSPLTQAFDLTVQRGHRVALIGPNGAGKSTLLRTFVGEQPALEGSVSLGRDVSVGYFAQEQAEVLPLQQTPLQVVGAASPGMDPRRARALLGALRFSRDDLDKPIGVLSGGEKNRVGLAKLLCCDANLLVLDEPTNHLDMASVDVLALALQAYAGTVIFASHSREFIDEVCTHILAVSHGGQAALFAGNIEDYRLACARTGFPDVLALAQDESSRPAAKATSQNTQTTATTSSPRNERRDERTQLRKTVANLEMRIAHITSRKHDIERSLEQCPAQDYRESHRLGTELADLVRELSEAEDLWFQAQERLEQL